MKNILISTGGSGGHVVPAKILCEHLQSNFNVFDLKTVFFELPHAKPCRII